MSIELKQHIELRGDDPLEAVIAGTTRIKAHLVANLAILDNVEAAVTQYKLTPAEVYAALTFYYDNEDAIREANEVAMEQIQAMGGKDSRDLREEINRRRRKND